MSKPKLNRNKEIFRRREKFKITFQELGDMFNISRQTAQTIYKREKARV